MKHAIKRSNLFITLMLSFAMALFGTVLISGCTQAKQPTAKYVKVANVIKYDDLQLEINDNGVVVAYNGAMQDVALNIPATFSRDEYGNCVDGQDYPITAIGQNVFKDVKFLYCSVDATNIVKFGKSCFENAEHIYLYNCGEFQTDDYAFKNCVFGVEDDTITIHGSEDQNYVQVGVEGFAGSSCFDYEYYSTLADSNGYAWVIDDGSGSYVHAANADGLIIPTDDPTITTQLSVRVQGGGYVNLANGSWYQSSAKSFDMSAFNGIVKIPDSFFNGCTKLKDITFGRGFCSIGSNAFKGCTNLKTVNPNSSGTVVTSLGSNAFSGCQSLSEVNFTTSTFTSIGSYAFYNCPLEKVYLPSTLPSGGIASNAFSTTKLSAITYKTNGNASVNTSNYGYTFLDGVVTVTYADVAIPSGIKPLIKEVRTNSSISKINTTYCFSSCKNLTTVNISGNVKTLTNDIFNGCIQLTSVTLGNGVQELGNGLFNGCTAIESISLPSSVTTIGSHFCYNCTSLEYISLNDGLKTIKHNAFENCTALTYVYIPASVRTIGANCFKNTGLTEAYIENYANPGMAGSASYSVWQLGTTSTKIRIVFIEMKPTEGWAHTAEDPGNPVMVSCHNELKSTYVDYEWTWQSEY